MGYKIGYGDFIKEYGKNITRSDVKDYASKGGTQQNLQKFLRKAEKGKKGFEGKIGKGAYDASKKAALFTKVKDKGFNSDLASGKSGGGMDYDKYYGDLGAGMTPAVFDQLAAESLETIKGQNAVDYANAVGANNVLVQQLISDSNDYASELNLEGVKYSSDRNLDIAQYQADSEERWRSYIADVEAENNLAVQGLKNQGAIDLQSIVNSGLKDVADIQGSYASERVQLQGEYDVERANIQSDFEKFKAARAKEGQMYGSLFAGFWN